MAVLEGKQKEILSFLRNPETSNKLIYQNGVLSDAVTGETFDIKNGIPIILHKEDVYGWNLRQQKGYNWGSYFYDLIYSLNLMNLKQWLSEIADIMEVYSNDYILETSVGTGQQLFNLTKHGVKGNLFGNDISFKMLRKCQKNLKKWGFDAGLVQGNAEALPFNSELFDVVFHVGGFNFFNDKKRAVNEMIRTAKSGARIYIVDESSEFINPSSLTARLLPKPKPSIYDPPLELIKEHILEVNEYKLLEGKFWMVSFQKPH